MSKAPYPRLEHLNSRLDVLSALAKNVASVLYEAECGVTLRDLCVLRFVDMQPGISLGPMIEFIYLEKTPISKLVTTLAKRGLLTRSYPAATRSLVLWAPNDSALLRLRGVESRLRNVARVEAMVRVEEL